MCIIAIRKQHELSNEDLGTLLGIGKNAVTKIIACDKYRQPYPGHWERALHVFKQEESFVTDVVKAGGLPNADIAKVRKKIGLTQTKFAVILSKDVSVVSASESRERQGGHSEASVRCILKLLYWKPNQTLRHLLDYAAWHAVDNVQREEVAKVRKWLVLPPAGA
jgi:DNA-binding transcriptional regulator YiaG